MPLVLARAILSLSLAASLAVTQAPVAPSEPVIVDITTSLGDIIIEVDTIHAPATAANFLRYVDGGFYSNGRFHRATRADNYTVNLPNRPLLECIQAGINPDMKARAYPPIPLERTSVTGLTHVIGTVSMARGAEADTATSDFFILLNNQPSLDFGGKRLDDGQGAAAFGRVVSGLAVVQQIQRKPTDGQSLKPPITILSAKRLAQ
jgi:peptidyl-prolyl cis-trans isomerase A (cyclophilin A)